MLLWCGFRNWNFSGPSSYRLAFGHVLCRYRNYWPSLQRRKDRATALGNSRCLWSRACWNPVVRKRGVDPKADCSNHTGVCLRLSGYGVGVPKTKRPALRRKLTVRFPQQSSRSLRIALPPKLAAGAQPQSFINPRTNPISPVWRARFMRSAWRISLTLSKQVSTSSFTTT